MLKKVRTKTEKTTKVTTYGNPGGKEKGPTDTLPGASTRAAIRKYTKDQLK